MVSYMGWNCVTSNRSSSKSAVAMALTLLSPSRTMFSATKPPADQAMSIDSQPGATLEPDSVVESKQHVRDSATGIRSFESTVQVQRILSDLVSTSSSPSTFTLDSAAATDSAGRERRMDKVNRKTAYEHRKKVLRRRNAISLSRVQAARIAHQLAPPPPASSSPSNESEIKAREAKQVRFYAWQLDTNLYLISRPDGHTITCPPKLPCTCTT